MCVIVRTRFPLQIFLPIQVVQHVGKAIFSLESNKEKKSLMAWKIYFFHIIVTMENRTSLLCLSLK